MTSLFRKFTWWLQRRRKEDELREELQFHLAEEAGERQADGLTDEQAAMGRAARPGQRDAACGKTRARCGRGSCSSSWPRTFAMALRTMFKNRVFTALAALSLALGIGANTAIYSFMDSILLRSLPVSDPASLVVVKWRSKPVTLRRAGRRSSCIPSTAAPTATRPASPRPSSRSRRSSGLQEVVGTGPVQPLRAQAGGQRERDDQRARRSSPRASTCPATSFAGSRCCRPRAV